MNNAEKTLEKFFNYYTTIPNLLHPIFEQHGSNDEKARAQLGNSSSFRNAGVKFASVAVFVDQWDTTNHLFLFSNH